MSDTALRADDLEPTDLGFGGDGEPQPTRPASGPGSRGGPGSRKRRTSVDPEEVNGNGEVVGGGETQTQAERRAAARKAKEDKARKEAVDQIHAVVDGKVNPALAMMSRMALQVPPEIDAWMITPRDEEGVIKIDKRGIPAYQYSAAAQMCILQPYEVEILTMVAPAAMNNEATEKLRAFGEKAAPFLAIGAVVAFVGSYALRLREVGKALEVEKAAYIEKLQAGRQADSDPIA